MTEHLALEQTLRDTAEIDFHKRLSGALTVDMDSFGYQFLTCTTLAGNEYGSVGTGYAATVFSTSISPCDFPMM